MLSDKILRRIFRRVYRSRLNEMLAPDYAAVLDYPIRVSPSYGYGKPLHPQILNILESRRTEFATRLTGFCRLKEFLSEIPDEPPTKPIDP
jgi:hypothetical protein